MPSPSPRYGVIASRFNEAITQRLVDSALDFLKEKKVSSKQIRLIWVPGAFELPAAALYLTKSRLRYQAIIAVGCILKGRTRNDRYLAQTTLGGLMAVSLSTGVPVTCGVITAQSRKLALARASRRGGMNRGREAAEAAWALVQTFRSRHAR
jgi:6,7-dimethyl-8-ribityllumazine synthase